MTLTHLKTTAVAKRSPWLRPSPAAFDALARRMDAVKASHDALYAAWDAVDARKPGADDRLQNRIDEWRNRGLMREAEACVAEWDRLQPEDHYLDSGGISRSRVSAELALLLGAFPTSNVGDPKIFTGMLIEEVMAEAPCWLPLASACRELVRTKTFVPAISEVLATLARHSKAWSDRFEASDIEADALDRAQADCDRMRAEASR